jgi:hypothetical protein
MGSRQEAVGCVGGSPSCSVRLLRGAPAATRRHTGPHRRLALRTAPHVPPATGCATRRLATGSIDDYRPIGAGAARRRDLPRRHGSPMSGRAVDGSRGHARALSGVLGAAADFSAAVAQSAVGVQSLAFGARHGPVGARWFRCDVTHPISTERRTGRTASLRRLKVPLAAALAASTRPSTRDGRRTHDAGACIRKHQRSSSGCGPVRTSRTRSRQDRTRGRRRLPQRIAAYTGVPDDGDVQYRTAGSRSTRRRRVASWGA